MFYDVKSVCFGKANRNFLLKCINIRRDIARRNDEFCCSDTGTMTPDRSDLVDHIY